MKKFMYLIVSLCLLSIPAMSQFASSKYKSSHEKYQFAKQQFDPGSIYAKNDAGTFKAGVAAGFLLSKFRDSDSDTKFRLGFYFGGEGMYYFTNQVVFLTGLLLAFNGSDYEDNFRIKMTSLMIPLMVGYWINTQFMAMLGVQPSFIFSAKDGNGENYKDFFKGVDFGLKFGLAYSITQELLARITYTHGLSDILDSEYNGTVKTAQIEIGAVYYLFQR
ncbi:porin family protein [Fulvivirga sedimenti]|uniref:PorT family protein n=1 Tax=Fulvivirga sedimenti TaxID=2879465 RepID=A0A9X1L337_9BACT|nr:porin family protein [Fulvivirga sedimenti]MCA6078841.1 PorT family protein [Fulvivirga sedimenti]